MWRWIPAMHSWILTIFIAASMISDIIQTQAHVQLALTQTPKWLNDKLGVLGFRRLRGLRARVTDVVRTCRS